jgi:hypothetical protein
MVSDYFDGKIVNRPDGGTCHCYGGPREGDAFHIVLEGDDYKMGEDFLWVDYDASIYGKTWSSVVKKLYKMYGWKVEQIQPC